MSYNVTEADIRDAKAQMQQADFAPLDDEMLDGVSGGRNKKRKDRGCPGNPVGEEYRWEKTGNVQLGIIWDDVEYKCQYCGEIRWVW